MASVRSRDAVAAWGVYKKWRAHLPLPSPPGASPASSLQAPATQAAQGFRSYTHGCREASHWVWVLWRRCRISCLRPLHLCTEPCRGPAVTSFSETPGETKESVSCVPVAESKLEEQLGAEPQKETESCPKIHSRRFREWVSWGVGLTVGPGVLSRSDLGPLSSLPAMLGTVKRPGWAVVIMSSW